MEQVHSSQSVSARKRNPDESKRRILDAAEKAFALRGFGGARLRDIAQEAGVHHALVHHYFDDKRGLFSAVMERGLSDLAGVTPLVFTPGLPLEQNVARLVGPLYDFFADHRDLLRVIEGALRDREAPIFADASATFDRMAQPLVSRLQQQVEAAQARGEMRRDMPAPSVLLHGLGALVTPFILGPGISAALSLPRPPEAPRSHEKAELVSLLSAALSPAD